MFLNLCPGYAGFYVVGVLALMSKMLVVYVLISVICIEITNVAWFDKFFAFDIHC